MTAVDAECYFLSLRHSIPVGECLKRDDLPVDPIAVTVAGEKGDPYCPQLATTQGQLQVPEMEANWVTALIFGHSSMCHRSSGLNWLLSYRIAAGYYWALGVAAKGCLHPAGVHLVLGRSASEVLPLPTVQNPLLWLLFVLGTSRTG